MKILLITEFFPNSSKLDFTGGVEARTYYLAKNLSVSDKVLVICRKTKDLQKFKKIGNIFIYPCGFSSSHIEANFLSVFERFFFILVAFFKGLKLDFDLVEGSNFVSFLPAYFLGLAKKKPAVVWYADVFKGRWLRLFGITGFFGEIIERISLKLAWRKIIALSQATKSKLVKEGIDEKKIEVVYGGVDMKEFRIQKKKKKNIICISRLVKYKRVEDLIKAFSQLTGKYPGLTLTIVGQGPEEKQLKELVKQKKLNKKVSFLKNIARDELVKILKQSYILCLASVVEGFGLVTIEAAACGVPYIVADIEVNKEITRKGQGGLFFKKTNIVDLKEKIELLLKDKKLYQEKQKQGLSLVKQYDWKKIAQETRKVYYQAKNDMINC